MITTNYDTWDSFGNLLSQVLLWPTYDLTNIRARYGTIVSLAKVTQSLYGESYEWHTLDTCTDMVNSFLKSLTPGHSSKDVP